MTDNYILLMKIDDTGYILDRVYPDVKSQVMVAWRFTKEDGETYVVSIGKDPRCECGDFAWRREGSSEPFCKHLLAAKDLGLLAPFLQPEDAVD